MKTLYILRHAKSSWDEPEKSDFDRSLKMRGINDVKLLAKKVKGDTDGIDLIISSPANRAIHTAILFAQAVGFPMDKLLIKENLYETTELEVQKLVKSLPDNLNKVMIVGHNPTSTHFTNLFLKETIFNIPTSGLVGLTFSVDKWVDIERGNLCASFFDFPKNS